MIFISLQNFKTLVEIHLYEMEKKLENSLQN